MGCPQVRNLENSKRSTKPRLSWRGVTPCSSRDVVQADDKDLYRKEHEGPCGTVCVFVAKEEEHTGSGQPVEKSNLDLYYLELVRLQ